MTTVDTRHANLLWQHRLMTGNGTNYIEYLYIKLCVVSNIMACTLFCNGTANYYYQYWHLPTDL